MSIYGSGLVSLDADDHVWDDDHDGEWHMIVGANKLCSRWRRTM